jgi:SRSO17 transposase
MMVQVDTEEMERVRPQLVEFAAAMLGNGALTYRSQSEYGELYVRGLMMDGRRKSIQPMAQRLGVDYQNLHHFITSSTWNHEVVLENLATWAQQTLHPLAHILDDVGFPKDGVDSPGVARQYSGALGKVGNCQIGVSVHLAAYHASVPVNWRLFLPQCWDEQLTDDEQLRMRRARCGIPQDVGHREKWRLAIDQLDQMHQEWKLPKLPVVGDAGYGDITEFRLALDERDIPYMLAVKGSTSAYAAEAVTGPVPCKGRGPRPKPQYPHKPTSLREMAMGARRRNLRRVTWRHGTKKSKTNPTAAMRGRFMAMRVRPANRRIPRDPLDNSLPECWLLIEWPAGEKEPTDYWLSTLPADTRLRDLVKLAKIRWRIENNYRELKSGIGMAHFEGRSYQGWHRHVTLASVALAFCLMMRLDPKVAAPA